MAAPPTLEPAPDPVLADTDPLDDAVLVVVPPSPAGGGGIAFDEVHAQTTKLAGKKRTLA